METVSLHATWQRLAELAALESDWDSYGGEPPSSLAIDTARRLLGAVAERVDPATWKSVEPSFVAPMPTGGVQLEWHVPPRELEVEIGPQGELGYLLATAIEDGEVVTEGSDASWALVVQTVLQILGD